MPKASRPSVVLFHSVLGRRPAVHAFAERLRDAGHAVHVPDLYHGETFDDYAEAIAFVEAFGGYPELIARTMRLAPSLPASAVYAGFSNGAGSAELLALTQPGARGAVLMHGCGPVAMMGAEAWPARVPAQLHYAERDPFREQPYIDGFLADVRASGAPVDFFEYPVDGHLFADDGLPDHDAAAAAMMLERVLAFLERVA